MSQMDCSSTSLNVAPTLACIYSMPDSVHILEQPKWTPCAAWSQTSHSGTALYTAQPRAMLHVMSALGVPECSCTEQMCTGTGTGYSAVHSQSSLTGHHICCTGPSGAFCMLPVYPLETQWGLDDKALCARSSPQTISLILLL